MSYTLTNRQVEMMHACGIPSRMHGGLIRYYNNRIPPGHFLTAVLENNLKESFNRADEENMRCLRAYVMWLYSYAPMGTWGSPEAVSRWLAREHELQQEEEAS